MRHGTKLLAQKMGEEQETRWHQKTVNPFLQEFIDQLNLQSGDTILVPLCGKSVEIDLAGRTGLLCDWC